MHPEDFSYVDELDSHTARVEWRCQILEDVSRDLVELAKSLREVLDEYIDTVDPEENDWTARNWNLKKQRIRRAYDEVMLKCATYKVVGDA